MSAEYATRWQHRTQVRPTSHWSRDESDTTPHPGPVAGCRACKAGEA